MIRFMLVPHGDFPSSAIRSIAVEASRSSGGRLELQFIAAGDVDRVRWPEWIGVEPADRLWEHSCFEAFVGIPDAPAYIEFNFATSGQWAAYHFDDYRETMRPVTNPFVSGGRTFGENEVRMRRVVALDDFATVPEWRLGLSAVIEAVDGSKSYWALAHPRGRPDFHASVCFAGRLAAPDAP